MGTFDAFRNYGGPTLYGPNKTAVTADVLEAGLIFAAVILFLSFLILMPGYRGKERFSFILKVLIGVVVTTLIMLCNFGQEWEVAKVHTQTQYRAGLTEEIVADISVKIGLRSINITLKTDPEVHEFELENETINYNERFSWDNMGFTQGRLGFGPFAGRFNQEFREAQWKGLPYPILWVAEYFTIDGEGIRWGRFYRQAGYYTHILMWLAFPTWILSMILFKLVLPYGAYFAMGTGGTLLLANVLFATIRNPLNLIIPFKDGALEFEYGWCFWANLINGILCLAIGFVVWYMDLRHRELIYTFFGGDILDDIEEYYSAFDELNIPTSHQNKRPGLNGAFDRNENGIEIDDDQRSDLSGHFDNNSSTSSKPHYRRRHGTIQGKFGRTQKSRPRPDTSGSEDGSTMRFRPGSIGDHDVDIKV